MVVFFARREASPNVAWPDECIYLAGARNLNERGTLDTNFYLTYSILARGHPHRDVHMPGYVLTLAPFVRVLGPGLVAGAALERHVLRRLHRPRVLDRRWRCSGTWAGPQSPRASSPCSPRSPATSSWSTPRSS